MSDIEQSLQPVALSSNTSKRKIVILKVAPNYLRNFHLSHRSVNMDSDSSSFPQPLEEIDKMIKRSGFWPMTKDLVSIKTSLAVVHKRHEEILKEKEEKILALQYKLSNQQSKEAELAKEIAELKEENADLKNWADRRNPDYKGLLYNLNEAEMALTSQNNVSKTLAEDLELIELQIKDMKRRAMRMAGDLVAAANKLSEAKPMAEAAPRRRRRSRYVLSESPDEFESVLSSKMSGDGCPSAKKDMSQKSEESPRVPGTSTKRRRMK